MNDTHYKSIPIHYGGDKYILQIQTLSNGCLNQDLLDEDGDSIASFYVPEEVTEDQCRWFLSGRYDGYTKGLRMGASNAQDRIVRALGLPVDLLYPKKED